MNYDTWKTTDFEAEAWANHDAALEAAQSELADDLFEAFYEDNEDVIDEVNDYLDHIEVNRERLINACEAISKRCKGFDDIESYRLSFKV